MVIMANFSLALLLSYLVTCLFGIPTILILKKLNKECHLAYAAIGFLIGFICVLFSSGINEDGLIAGAMYGTVGLLTSLCFSLIQGKKEKKYA